MAVKAETSVTPDTGIGEIAKVLRQYAANNDAVYSELTSAMRDLRMTIREVSAMNMGSRLNGPELTGSEVKALLGAGSPSLRPTMGRPSMGVPRSSPSMAPPEGILARPGPGHPRSGAPAPLDPELLPHTFTAGRRQGLHGLRSAVLGRMSQAANNLGSGTDLAYEEIHVPASFEVAPGDILDRTTFGGEEFGGENAWETKSVWRNANSLQVVEPSVAKSSMRSAVRAAAVKRGIQTWAQSGSLGEGVAAAAPAVGKALGVAGVAVGAAITAQRQYAQLVEQGRPYQGVLGGSTAEGVTESFREKLFSIGNRWAPGSLFNPVSERDSRAIYEGALGLYAGNREMRNQAQSMMLSSLRSMGMRPEDSLQILQTAAKAGNDAIAQIATSLKEVTKTARDAGMNADEARKRFGEAYATISRSVGGAQGIVMAQAQANVLTAMGHRFEGTSLDTSSTSAMVWQSMLTGQTPGQVWAVNNSPGGALVQAQVSDTRRRLAAERTGFTSDKVLAIIQREGWDRNKLTTAQQSKIAAEIMASTPSASPAVVLSALTAAGQTGLTIANAPLAAVRAVSGADSLEAEVAKETGELIPQAGSEAYPRFQSALSLEGLSQATKDQLSHAKVKIDPQALSERLGISKEDAAKALMQVEGSGKNAKGRGSGKIGAVARYIAHMERTGETDPVLERLIKSYDNSRRYRVQTKNGEIAVGNFELINDFADQAASGGVMIDKGQGQGLTIAEQLGIQATQLPGYGQDAASAEDASLASKYGTNDKWKLNEGTPTGTIVVRVGAELQKWIDFQATGGASVVYSNAGIPASGTVTADQRASGGG